MNKPSEIVVCLREAWDRVRCAMHADDLRDANTALTDLAQARLIRITSAPSSHQVDLEAVLEEIAQVRLEKIGEYGENRYNEDDPKFNQLMLFSDVHRKYIRLRHQALGLTPGTPETRAKLRETYLDMAAYAAMGVQMIDREERIANAAS